MESNTKESATEETFNYQQYDLQYEKHPDEIVEKCEEEKTIVSSEDEAVTSTGRTNWKMVIIAAILYFLTNLESTFTGLNDWPYMNTIFVERFDTKRRYVMLACYILFAIASASSVVLRVYIVRISLAHDRVKGFGALTLGKMASMILGPLVQLAFSPIGYPGGKIGNGVYFNMYSAPIWVAMMLNFLTIFFIFCILQEIPYQEKSKKEPRKAIKINKEKLKEWWKKLVGLEVNWPVIILSLFEVCVLSIALASVASLISVIFMETFGFGKSRVIIWISVVMASVGLLSLVITLFYMVTPLIKWIPPRFSFLISLVVAVFFYVITYPYPGMSNPVPMLNRTTLSGCNPFQYHWCHGARATYPGLFIPVVIAVIGIALPFATISLDIIYTQKCGKANQTIMQGLIVLVYNIINVLAPLWSTMIFTNNGQYVLWICNGSFSLAGTAIWLVFMPWLKVKAE